MSRLHTTRSRRGNYSVILGISAIMLLGFTALGVDTGWQRVAMTQLHNAADAGAHAGALLLDGSAAGVTAAETRAFEVAQANLVHGQSVVLAQNRDVIIGRYDVVGESDCANNEGCWTPIGSTPASTDYSPSRIVAVTAADANAVYVQAGEDVETIFGAFPFGRNTIPAANFAIARLPIVDGQACAFPLVMPQCMADEWDGGSNACNKTVRVRLKVANQDVGAWAYAEGADPGGADAIQAALTGENCESDFTAEDIDDGDSDVRLQSGQVQSAFQILADQVHSTNISFGTTGIDYSSDPIAETTWNTTAWGTCPSGTASTYCDPTTQIASVNNAKPNCPTTLPDCANGPFIMRDMAVFDSGTCDSNGNPSGATGFNTNEDLSGFVRVIIYNVEVNSAGDKYFDAFVSCVDPVSGNAVTEPVHTGYDSLIEPPEDGGLSIVE